MWKHFCMARLLPSTSTVSLPEKRVLGVTSMFSLPSFFTASRLMLYFLRTSSSPTVLPYQAGGTETSTMALSLFSSM